LLTGDTQRKRRATLSCASHEEGNVGEIRNADDLAAIVGVDNLVAGGADNLVAGGADDLTSISGADDLVASGADDLAALVGDDDLVAGGGSASHGKKRERARWNGEGRDRSIFIPVRWTARLPRFNSRHVPRSEESREGAPYIEKKAENAVPPNNRGRREYVCSSVCTWQLLDCYNGLPVLGL